MKTLWNNINKMHWNNSSKFKAYSAFVCALFGAAGFCLWSLLRIWVFNSPDLALCFIGYPVVIGWIASILYVYNHPFFRIRSTERETAENYLYYPRHV